MSTPSSERLALASEFPPATREQWLTLVQHALKGRTFDQALVAKTSDDLKIEPLHARRAIGPSLAATRAPGTPWQVVQRVDLPDLPAANSQALDDLADGASGLTLVAAGSLGARGYGLTIGPETIDRILDGVLLDAGIGIELDWSPRSPRAAIALGELVLRSGFDPASLDIRFNIDPLGAALIGGGFAGDDYPFKPSLVLAARALSGLGFRRSLLCADGRIVHDAGGTEAQELAYVIGCAVAYLRALENGGIPLDDARHMITFRMTADTDQFLTIAKFRALRMLWRRIEESCGVAPAPAFIGAETAWRVMTRNDAATNILRATIATFAAGIGGADAITVLPYTSACGLPDGFARRLARNTQLVLLDEANVARVADPTAGTGWSEDLAEQLCRAAWTIFQEIEAAGGACAALESGLIQARVAEARARRERDIARRKDALIGANEFPALNEMPTSVLDVSRVVDPAAPIKRPLKPLPQRRLAEPFEALRDASDRIVTDTGMRPRIFLATLGTPAAFTARATFAKNLFEAGGIEAISNDGSATIESRAAAFTASGARIACLCGTDDAYLSDAVAAARALKAAGARHLYLAGRPGDHEAALREAAIDTFVFAGCDALKVLQEVHDRLKTNTQPRTSL